MKPERVTVSLPAEVRQAAAAIADQRGESFSTVVASALSEWMRGQLVDLWAAEYQEEHGVFDEAKLRALAAEAGVPHLPPGRPVARLNLACTS